MVPLDDTTQRTFALGVLCLGVYLAAMAEAWFFEQRQEARLELVGPSRANPAASPLRGIAVAQESWGRIEVPRLGAAAIRRPRAPHFLPRREGQRPRLSVSGRRRQGASGIASLPPFSELPRNDGRGSLAELLRCLRLVSFLAMTVAAR